MCAREKTCSACVRKKYHVLCVCKEKRHVLSVGGKITSFGREKYVTCLVHVRKCVLVCVSEESYLNMTCACVRVCMDMMCKYACALCAHEVMCIEGIVAVCK